MKAQKLVELMMVSGVRTSSGFEERIRFSELEIVDRDAIDTGVMSTLPEGNYINGWDVNVAGVRITSVKRNIRYHKHAVSLIRPVVVGFPRCLTANRSFSFESRRRASWSILLVDVTVISADSTSSCGRSCRARYCHHCPRRTSPTRPYPTYWAASPAALIRRRRPSRQFRRSRPGDLGRTEADFPI